VTAGSHARSIKAVLHLHPTIAAEVAVTGERHFKRLSTALDFPVDIDRLALKSTLSDQTVGWGVQRHRDPADLGRLRRGDPMGPRSVADQAEQFIEGPAHSALAVVE